MNFSVIIGCPKVEMEKGEDLVCGSGAHVLEKALHFVQTQQDPTFMRTLLMLDFRGKIADVVCAPRQKKKGPAAGRVVNANPAISQPTASMAVPPSERHVVLSMLTSPLRDVFYPHMNGYAQKAHTIGVVTPENLPLSVMGALQEQQQTIQMGNPHVLAGIFKLYDLVGDLHVFWGEHLSAEAQAGVRIAVEQLGVRDSSHITLHGMETSQSFAELLARMRESNEGTAIQEPVR